MPRGASTRPIGLSCSPPTLRTTSRASTCRNVSGLIASEWWSEHPPTHVSITNAAASQLVDKLVQAGLVARTEAAHDRRVRQLALTDQGRALVKSSLEARLSWTRGLGESLPPAKRDAIIHALSEMIEAGQQLEQPEA